VKVYKQHEESEQRLAAVVQVQAGGESFDAQVMDESGTVYLNLKGYRTVQLPVNIGVTA
jgi:hypothetical protein